MRHAVLLVVVVLLATVVMVPTVCCPAWGETPVAGAVTETGLYNEGNAHARAGAVGRAVLAYERARRLDPRDPDLLANLRTVSHQAGLPPVTPSSWWKRRVLGGLSVDAFTELGGAALLLLALLFLFRGLFPWLHERFPRLGEPSRRLRGFLVLACVVALVVGAMGTHVWLGELDHAVVVDGDLALRVSPFEKAETLMHVPEGSLVKRVRAFKDDWVEVQTQDGRKGWAPRSRVVDIVPGA